MFDIDTSLKEVFGFDSFRTGQREIIEQVLAGKNTLGILPTGAGKSVCYQLPGLLLDGLTLVISPLISLMKDQVDSLSVTGVPATFINSTVDDLEVNARLRQVESGKIKLLFIAPERLQSDYFVNFLSRLPIRLVAIDEAHCISQWGHDFRPSYVEFAPIIKTLPSQPIFLALTATATAKVADDILHLLDIPAENLVKTSFLRENLRFEVQKNPDKRQFLKKYLKNHQEDSGLIYAATRKDVEEITDFLNNQGFSATRYHAGLSEDERRQNQEDFLYDKVNIVVATNAFGMGINKSNVRFVIHYSSPATIEAYYQEAGRAGRDGLPSDAILFFAPNDIRTRYYLIDQSEGEETHKDHEREKLRAMQAYANTESCLQRYILRYFGDDGKDCGLCSNCMDERVAVDITIDAQKILSCVIRMGEHFGKTLTAQVLIGSNNQNVKKWHFEKLSTYGTLSHLTQKSTSSLIDFLISEDYLEVTAGEFPMLTVSPLGRQVLKGQTLVFRREVIVQEKPNKSKILEDYDETLFQKLRELRLKLSRESKLPPYLIFSDKALRDMTRIMPTNDEEFLEVSGVGEAKLERYGKVFLAEIGNYQDETA